MKKQHNYWLRLKQILVTKAMRKKFKWSGSQWIFFQNSFGFLCIRFAFLLQYIKEWGISVFAHSQHISLLSSDVVETETWLKLRDRDLKFCRNFWKKCGHHFYVGFFKLMAFSYLQIQPTKIA